MLLLKKLSFLNQRHHILFLSSWYPSRVLPNNGDFVQRHAEAVATKHQVTLIHVISDENLAAPIEITENNINDVRTLIAYVKVSSNPIIKLYRFFSAYLNLIKRVGKFDLTHLNVIYPVGLIALYLKWFKKKPFIVSEHWHKYHKPFCNAFKFWEKSIIKLVAKNASHICPVTNNLGDAMKNFGVKNNYTKVPNVVDTNIFKPKEKIHKTFNIIHISSMDVVKNVSEILKVISKINAKKIDFKFFLIGENANDFKSLSDKLTINSKNIFFINQLPQQDLVTYLQQANVLVLFSTIENSPCVILEAFSCGIPVISTDVGGVSEHFPKDFGTLIPANDSNVLLDELIKNYESSKTVLKEDMHTYIEQNFSKKSVAKQFTKVYLSVLKK